MYVLGLSGLYHDSAAALLRDGDIVAAAQEERFTRKKHDASFPENAIKYCLEEADIALSDVDAVVFYEKPFLKFERLLETYFAFAPRGFTSFRRAMPVWMGDKLFQKRNLKRRLTKIDDAFDFDEKMLFAEHHLSHAASAFYPSPFARAAVLTIDGVGEATTTSLAVGNGSKLTILKELQFPHSLGLLYAAATYYTGFKINSGEYKMMGLAPYGEPRYTQRILDNLIDLKSDGSFRLDVSFFDYCTGLRMTNDRFDNLFGRPARHADQPLEQFHMDIAASFQAATEEIMIRLCEAIARETGETNLCLAGGVALNCVANGKVLRRAAFKDIWIQPAAGDAGGALGAAYCGYFLSGDRDRRVSGKGDAMRGSYLGPRFSTSSVTRELTKAGASFTQHSDDEIIAKTAQLLADGRAVGWMQGRMEFGPRALGGRSILADPRSADMQKVLNLKVKYRESFRPFAPAILAEKVEEWFDLKSASPYMLIVADIASERRRNMTDEERSLFGIDKLNVPRSEIPAVTHVDYSARVQTVHADTNPRFHKLLRQFEQLTDCPVLVNTSFNVRGEPIVCTPADAFRCFMGTEIEALVVENCLLLKEDQDQSLKLDYKNAFELD